MAINALLYSADAPDQVPELATIDVDSLTVRQLLWLDLSSATPDEVRQIATLVDCETELLKVEASDDARPRLANYSSRFRITVKAASLESASAQLTLENVTLIAGPNYVITLHEAGADFLDELRNREKGDSTIGVLSSESFVASVLGWLLNSYFRSVEVLVRDIDAVEVAILAKKKSPDLYQVLVSARKRTAELRRFLVSHRDVFYGLSRPDFTVTEQPEAKPHFDALNLNFERAEDDLDNARNLVVGSFELLSMLAAQRTNETMRALTFITVLMGTLALIAGLMGMNFNLEFFSTGISGFLIVTGAMALLAVVAVWIARKRSWIG